MLKKLLRWRLQCFFKMKEGWKMICVKIIPRLVVAQEGTNTLIFYVFEYDAEYGTEYSAESGAKQYFV